LVYVAVLNIRRQRLEVAENLEGNIPDVTAFEIIESLKDYLRAGLLWSVKFTCNANR